MSPRSRQKRAGRRKRLPPPLNLRAFASSRLLLLIAISQDGTACSHTLHLCTSPLSSDVESVTDDDDFEPLETPGGKLDGDRYEAYHRSLKPMRGIARPSEYEFMCLLFHSTDSCTLRLVHTEGQSKVHEILRIFDLNDEYGPCVGFSRLARWERAHKAGLNPPIQVRHTEHALCQSSSQCTPSHHRLKRF